MSPGLNPKDFVRYASLGLEPVIALALCLVAGIYIDRWQGGGGTWVVAGAVVGFVASIYRLVRLTRHHFRGGKDRR